MSFSKIEDEILVFCYDGSSELQLLKKVVKKHLPNLESQELLRKTQKVLNSLINNQMIKYTKSNESKFFFCVTSKGEDSAEDILEAQGMSEFIKQ